MSHRAPEPVVVIDYDPSWTDEFERLEKRAFDVLGPLVQSVEHVGSTAVRRLAAKPIVDLYVLVASPDDVPEAIGRLEAAGYRPEGDLGVPGREGLVWPGGERRHHLYVAVEGDPRVLEVLEFRDRLRRDPAVAEEYARLKRELAARFRDDRDAYAAGKTAFVERVLGSSRT